MRAQGSNTPDTGGSEAAESIAVHECWALIRQSPVGRLAVVTESRRPEIFPVNHVVDHGSIVFRTSAGTKLAAATGRPVAYEVDGYDVASSSAWSVVVKGRARPVRRLHEAVDAMGLPLFPWHTSTKPHFVRIEPDEVTGRRFVVTGGTRDPAGASAP